jgi:hypothetical protein
VRNRKQRKNRLPDIDNRENPCVFSYMKYITARNAEPIASANPQMMVGIEARENKQTRSAFG